MLLPPQLKQGWRHLRKDGLFVLPSHGSRGKAKSSGVVEIFQDTMMDNDRAFRRPEAPQTRKSANPVFLATNQWT
jgi:hypothetical protein